MVGYTTVLEISARKRPGVPIAVHGPHAGITTDCVGITAVHARVIDNNANVTAGGTGK
jgi:hypothetical protein